MRQLDAVSMAVPLLLMTSASACGNSAPTPQTTAGSDSTAVATAAQATTVPATKPPASDGRATVEREFEDFDPKSFDRPTTIDNPWWPLNPGTQFVYKGFTTENDQRVPHRLESTVTDLTKVINGVRAVVVYEKDFSDEQLVESELAFFAQDNDGNVWHLGQYRETYDEKEFVGGRAFLVGHLAGARAGIMMPAEPRPGTPSYSQGYGPPPFNWTDRGRVYRLGEKTRVPAGSYEDVLVTEEFNREEPGAIQLKYYARGVGNVRAGWKGSDPNQETLELVKLVRLEPGALARVRAEALQLEERAYVYGRTPPAEHTPPAK
jgi:hypothetical protein